MRQSIRVLVALPGVLLLVSVLFSSGQAFGAETGMSAQERLECQRTVEEIRWSHRDWPDANPGPKPALSTVLSEETLQRRAEDSMRMSAALEQFYAETISTSDLQAEMDRIARSTRAPDQLEDFFDALDNDPVKIAECIARPALARRKLFNAFAYDDEIHGGQRSQLQAQLVGKSELSDLAGVDVETTVYVRASGNDSASGGAAPGGASEGAIRVAPQRWDRLRAALGLAGSPDGTGDARSSSGGGDQHALRLQESEYVFFVRRVVESEPDRLVVNSVSWRKHSFEEWWREARTGLTSPGPVQHSGLEVPGITGQRGNSQGPGTRGSNEGFWYSPHVTAPRGGHTAVWTGSEMIVWGGIGATGMAHGGRYSPATDTWEATAIAGLGRPESHTAVWTGSEMIVWGGDLPTDASGSGARYDPTTDSWTDIEDTNAPRSRFDHTAVWTGSEMIIWGGGSCCDEFNSGGRYDPATDTWTDVSEVDVPAVRTDHTAVWTGSKMIVWGGWSDGEGPLNSGGQYDPSTDTWSATDTSAAPEARDHHTAVWTGNDMIIWGGTTNMVVNSGARYDPAADSWTPVETANAPSGRLDHTAVWTGSEMIVWGGRNYDDTVFETGGRYDPVSDTWTSMATTAVEPRAGHTAVWTGTEMIVMGGGGRDDYYPDRRAPTTGNRYRPDLDLWSGRIGRPTAPARFNHAAVWTGSEMLLWGGDTFQEPGGRYSPAFDTWRLITPFNEPPPEEWPGAVWTGKEMIVWGGGGIGGIPFDTGGHYDPVNNSWTATPVEGAPSGRRRHTTIWTGNEMIVWGGEPAGGGDISNTTGGRYDPATRTWTPMSTAGAPTSRYKHTAVWTGSEMIVWGGDLEEDTDDFVNTGGVYDPASDSWTIINDADAPVARIDHTAVWTGSDMIVWGGGDGGGVIDGGSRYNLSSDTWTPVASSGEPNPRAFHTAVWTGSEMIIWGGAPFTNTGGRYDPVSDSWTPTTTVDAPPPVAQHTAVWTGDAMIVSHGLGGPDICCDYRDYGVYTIDAPHVTEVLFENSFEAF